MQVRFLKFGWLPVILIFIIGGVVGWFVHTTFILSNNAPDQQRKYPLLSKRIFSESQNDILINFTPLRTAMREYAAKQPEKIGVYFEYLPSGTSIGVNDQVDVKLASLIKVPVVMAVYKQVEDGNISLDASVMIKKQHLDSRFGELWKRGVGTKISLEEAIRYALVDSDNTAAALLADLLPDDAIVGVFDALDLPKFKEGDFVILSTKNYSSILRSLYLSSYLQRSHSNIVLGLLTETKFNDKIPAGVPAGTIVAHKIGVFKTSGEQEEQIFNDCGIVYVPNRPYILCIMATGSEDAARKHMQHISKMVYGYVERADS
jgi:beta-lactamase class A